MAPRSPKSRDNTRWKDSKWRQSDKVRRQAIHAFVRSHKDELLKELPHRALLNKETKRNELVRVGRIRFAQLPEEMQTRFFETVEVQAEEPQVAKCPSVGASDSGVLVSRSPDPGAHAVTRAQPAEAPAVNDPASSTAAVCSPALLRGAGGDSAVRSAIMAEFTYLQKKFSGPCVFDVLAAAFRLLEQIGENMQGESDRVKAAICLGIGAKLAAVSPSYTLDIWKRFVTPKMVPYMRCVEVRVLAAWAKSGL